MAHLDSPAASDAELAAKLLRHAGALARSIRDEGLSALRAGRQVKSGASDFVTGADLAAEHYFFDALRAARPDDSILGEEGSGHAGTSGRCWVIDPVDGTFNFAAGSTYWCTALALVRTTAASAASAGERANSAASAGEGTTPDPLTHAEVLLGAIHQPEEDKLWIGGAGLPATLNGRPIRVDPQPELAELAAATYIHPGWLAQPRAAVPWQRAAELPATLRMLGSGSCDLARVAQGELGVWFQHSAPSWDWLPGRAIVEAAGGDTAVVRVNGLDWFLGGPAGAVAQLRAALTSGTLP